MLGTQKKAGPRGPGAVCRSRTTGFIFQREQPATGHELRRFNRRRRPTRYGRAGTAAAPGGPHVCHAWGCATNPRGSITPALRLADEEVAEGLHAGDRLELLRVDEIGVERDGFLLAEQLHQPAILLDDVIR